MTNPLQDLEGLYDKSHQVSLNFKHLPERDIRRYFFEIINEQILISLLNFKVNQTLHDKYPEDFNTIFQSNENVVKGYLQKLILSFDESIADTLLLQTELVFRFYYSKLTSVTPGEGRSLFEIFSILFDDILNNWQKEECRLLVLFWTLRNTIHTGGIYFKNRQGAKVFYKGIEYKFEYGKAPAFLKDGFINHLLNEMLESLKILLSTEKINNLGNFEHPNFFAIS
jgi:hypothetical protein